MVNSADSTSDCLPIMSKPPSDVSSPSPHLTGVFCAYNDLYCTTGMMMCLSNCCTLIICRTSTKFRAELRLMHQAFHQTNIYSVALQHARGPQSLPDYLCRLQILNQTLFSSHPLSIVVLSLLPLTRRCIARPWWCCPTSAWWLRRQSISPQC